MRANLLMRLGQLRHYSPPASGGELASDAFTRANADTLGANWTTGATSPGINTNAVDSTSTSNNATAFWNGVAWPVDQYSQATVVATTALIWAVGVRMQTGAPRDAYFAGYNNNDFGTQRAIWKEASGTPTLLAEEAGVPVIATDVIKITATGVNPTTLKMYVNGSERLSITDSDYDSGNAGIMIFDDALDVPVLDLWSGGSV